MIWVITGVAFVGTSLLVMAIVLAFSSGSMPITERLARLWRPVPIEEDVSFKDKQVDRAQKALSKLGKLVPKSTKELSHSQRLMVRAGFHRPEAVTALVGAQIVLPIVLLSFVYFSGFYKDNPIVFVLFAVIGGYLLPELWLTSRIRRRQQTIRLALPDALDLLVICVEAGLALDHAIMRVAQELKIAHPELCMELDIVNREMRVGKPRLDALRDLAQRTGVDDLNSLVAMLIQTDRFGTSVAQSLRVHSDQLRMLRRQRAEEQAAKTSVKMVPPLVFFIFPALFVVLLGPAVITVSHFIKTL
jgi:tight adherence protein C